tara:strand:- start:444 stop:797 length:354 start_codon:yes stop_codon:yes gene_type:complete
MRSQIFHTAPPKEVLIEFIHKYGEQQTQPNEHVFSNSAFKKAKYQDEITKFIDSVKNFYYNSKRKYVDRKMTFKHFSNVLRQICRFYKITFYSKIKYRKSKHETDYYIILSDSKENK